MLYIIKLNANSMKNQIFVAISVAIAASVVVTGFAPAFAQPTTGLLILSRSTIDLLLVIWQKVERSQY